MTADHKNESASRPPLVSVIIPFFNREKFLGEAVESVLGQTATDWELILVDDGSTDHSRRIAEEFVRRHPEKIRVAAHPDGRNRGASAARNLGIGQARGEYLTFLDSDDVLLPDALERELRAFAANPAADAVCGTLECWYSWSPDAGRGERDFPVDLVLETEKLYRPPALLIHNLRAGGRKPGIDCVMLKTEFARRHGVFAENYRHAWEDQVFWAKVSLHGQIYVMDALLARYRQHPASTCAVETRGGRDLTSLKIFLSWLEDYLDREQVADPEVRRALRGFRRANRLETRLRGIKNLYRRMLPLHLRYQIRDRLTRIKQLLTRTPERHK